MAEAQAGHSNAPAVDPQQDIDPNADPAKKDEPAPGKTYSQEEVDRILSKVRKNARYLGRKEAESELLRQGVTQRQADNALDRRDPPKDEDAEPVRGAEEDYETFQRRLASWEGRKAAREERAKEKQEEKTKVEREQHEKAAQTWHGKIQQAIDKHPDFEEVLEEQSDTLNLVHGSPMRGAITESDIGPQIVYALCKSPAEAKRIAALPAYRQAAEIAKIEDRLTAATQKPASEKEDQTDDDAPADDKAAGERNPDGTFKPKKETPKVAPPIEPVGARSATASSKPSDKDDPEAWRRKRIAELKARR